MCHFLYTNTIKQSSIEHYGFCDSSFPVLIKLLSRSIFSLILYLLVLKVNTVFL